MRGRLGTRSVGSIVTRFCTRGEWQQCGLRPQHSETVLKVGTGAATVLLSIRRLFEVTFVNLLDVQHVLVAAANIVLDHQFGELRAVDKHYPRP